MSMRIAVTGASGHIGNVVCRLLLQRGYKVKAFYQSDKRSLEGLDVDLVQGDVLKKEDLSKLIEGCEVVINCAAIISLDKDVSGIVFKTNTEGPRNICEVSILKGVKRIIHLSSVHAVTELPHSLPYDENRPYKSSDAFTYDHSKARGEQILLEVSKNKAIEVVILRPSCVIGPFDFKPSKMGTALLDFYRGKVPFLPPGGYDLVDVRDVAQSIVNAIEKGRDREIYLLSGKYYDFKMLGEFIKRITNKSVPKIVLPYWFLRAILPFMTIYYSLTHTAASLTRESIDAIKNGHPNMIASKAQHELEHDCRSLEETLKDFYEWQKNRKII